MIDKTGGPAFPTRMEGGPYLDPQMIPGMTLRDYFAAKAMAVCLAECKEFPDENWRIGVALDAYMMADAMIAARQAVKPSTAD